MKRFSSTGLKIFILICIGSLLLAGFSRMAGQYSETWLQDQPLSLDVKVLRQSRGTSCGEAVIAMVYNYGSPQGPITEEQVIDYATAQGYYTEDLSPFTSPANMGKIARHYVKDVSSGIVLNSDEGLSLLVQNLQNGEPVIIDVLSNFKDPESEAHFIVVTGVSVDTNRNHAVVIQYNDPFTGIKESADWTGKTGIWNAWQNNRDPGGSGWWMVLSPP